MSAGDETRMRHRTHSAQPTHIDLACVDFVCLIARPLFSPVLYASPCGMTLFSLHSPVCLLACRYGPMSVCHRLPHVCVLCKANERNTYARADSHRHQPCVTQSSCSHVTEHRRVSLVAVH